MSQLTGKLRVFLSHWVHTQHHWQTNLLRWETLDCTIVSIVQQLSGYRIDVLIHKFTTQKSDGKRYVNQVQWVMGQMGQMGHMGHSTLTHGPSEHAVYCDDLSFVFIIKTFQLIQCSSVTSDLLHHYRDKVFTETDSTRGSIDITRRFTDRNVWSTVIQVKRLSNLCDSLSY